MCKFIGSTFGGSNPLQHIPNKAFWIYLFFLMNSTQHESLRVEVSIHTESHSTLVCILRGYLPCTTPTRALRYDQSRWVVTFNVPLFLLPRRLRAIFVIFFVPNVRGLFQASCSVNRRRGQGTILNKRKTRELTLVHNSERSTRMSSWREFRKQQECIPLGTSVTARNPLF